MFFAGSSQQAASDHAHVDRKTCILFIASRLHLWALHGCQALLVEQVKTLFDHDMEAASHNIVADVDLPTTTSSIVNSKASQGTHRHVPFRCAR